jgi:hypothetical protein
MTHRWVTKFDSLYDFIGYVVLSAPDEFPQEDFLRPEDQMTLDRAFEELAHGVLLVEQDFPGADRQRGLSAVLERSLAAYRAGDSLTGAHSLQDFQDLIFKR